MMELAINTITADSKIGSQSALRKSMPSLLKVNVDGRNCCEAILFQGGGQARRTPQGWLASRPLTAIHYFKESFWKPGWRKVLTMGHA